ncbi:MAG: hypothetical protein WBN59_04690 [Flavobacteriaceae bacterium]
MEDQKPNHNSTADEIDLGQIFKSFKNGLNILFNNFLRLFLYIKKNIIKFAVLIIVGILIGLGLNTIVQTKLKTEVIVKPNLESKVYLYDIVNSISANLEAKDSSFFGALNIDVDDLQGFEIEIEPVEQVSEVDINDQIEYLEMLEKFRDEEGIIEVVRNEILNKTNLQHRIIFYYKDADTGRDITEKLISYINSNEYYNELLALQVANANERIKKNSDLVDQIDRLIAAYSGKLERDKELEGTLVLNETEQLDVPALLMLKEELIQGIEIKKLQIQEQKQAIRIISFGDVQQIEKTLFTNIVILVPLILVLAYLLWDMLKYLNRKANELVV